MAQAVAATVRAVKTGRKFIPRKAAIVLTQSAVEKVRALLAESKDAGGSGLSLPVYPPQVALRVGVRTRGCNGLSYTLDYASARGKLDEEVAQDGVHIFIDAKAQLTLLGTEMDFKETKLSSEFIFNNPNVKGTCGCGESFTV